MDSKNTNIEKPNFYAIIPADVRYDNTLKANEKLLFGEITALTGKEGYCFANNGYFAALYGVAKETISRWVNRLEKKGYLKSILIKNDTGQIISRHLYINQRLGGIDEKVNRGIDQIVNNNNKYINNIYIVFEKWNSKQNVINHKKLSKQIEDKCTQALKDYDIEDILQSIERLDTAVGDETYFYDNRWSLYNFLKQGNGITNWLDEGQQWNNYIAFKNQKKKDSSKVKNNPNTEIKKRKEL